MTASAAFRLTTKPALRGLSGAFAVADKELVKIRRAEMRHLARRMVSISKEEAPEKTGKFKQGIGFRTYAEGNTVGFTVHHPKPLGTWIVEGTKAHIIRAKASSLAFFWAKGPKGAGVYFFRQVYHPGTKPNRYLGRAYRRWLPGARKSLLAMAKGYWVALQNAVKK